MSKLDKYKVEHLFLLIGENPLPNYIAARTLLTDAGTVYLVYSNQTLSQKNCLKGIHGLKNENLRIKIKEIELKDYESNSYQIRDRIQKCLKTISNGSVGLNYTGGTKAMAVHAYKAVQEIKNDAVFSYLDSRKLKMCIDQQGDEPLKFDIHLQLTPEELFKLHNDNYWLENKPPISQPFLPDIADKFALFYCDDNLANEWKDWIKKFRKMTKNNGFWKSESDLKEIPIIPLTGLSEHITNILRQELNTQVDKLSLSITQKKGFKSLTEVCQWLDGIWLEHYVLQQIKKIESEFHIKESMMSFHIKDSQASWRERFEFDVAFIKGYQLFAISCTTSNDKKLCKQKLFEAHLRARQLGGDEARVALVCFFHKPNWIKGDMRFAFDDRKIEVFGLNDIKNLADGIENWIEKNNQEANV